MFNSSSSAGENAAAYNRGSSILDPKSAIARGKPIVAQSIKPPRSKALLKNVKLRQRGRPENQTNPLSTPHY
jgi:hypothetical protein